MTDARFEDGADQPVRLLATEAEDVPVISALIQDALAQVSDIAWMKHRRRVAILLRRFRWEDRDAADRVGRGFERVQAMLVIDSVLALRAQGFSPQDKDLVLSALALEFQPGTDGAGTLTMTVAGDGALALDVECLDLRLQDVSRPYAALARKAPEHPLD